MQSSKQSTMKSKRRTTIIKWILVVFAVILLLMVAGTVLYVNDYYHADMKALEALQTVSDNISIEKESFGDVSEALIYMPENPVAGIVFYPGAKVQYEAYAPLALALAENDIAVVIVKMPCNLAILNQDAASDVIKSYPEIDSWYIAGHSLGGAMAADFVADHDKEYEGIILLAAYSMKDLSELELDVISIYGTEDQVLSTESYEKYRSNLGKDYQEVVIDGGCHAYFGSYGPQDGDGTPLIDMESQLEQTSDAIEKFIVDNMNIAE